MDPFTISTGLAGFLSLAFEITKILTAYVSDVKSAPEEARGLLSEVSALCNVLDQLVNFLRNDVKGNFTLSSALYVAIMACQTHIGELYKKIEKLQIRSSDGKISKIINRTTIAWPFLKDEYQSTLVALHRFAQTFQFSLSIKNW
jgi:hypothetical protein